jgi:periplasmic divalent cation tolerance protein
MKTDYIIVLMTTSNKQEAEKITVELLNYHLIACANVINSVSSFYSWAGKIESSDECLVVMKTRFDLFAQVKEKVQDLHSYEVPEVIALPIVEGSKAYLRWMESVLSKRC